MTVYTQDDPGFPAGVADRRDDTGLSTSLALDIETVPTLVRFAGGVETGRVVGWSRAQWAELTGVADLGEGLPEHRPGCGSRTLDPDVAEELLVRTRGGSLRSRRLEITALEDEAEALFDRGFTDGLPVVAPTPARVLRMLEGTSREPDEVVAVIPPNLVEATVEKVAVNAVLAGCRPGVPARRARRRRGGLHRRVQRPRPARHHLGRRPGDRGQRAGPRRDRDELGRQRAGPGQPGQLDDRAGAAAGHPQRRRRAARGRSTGPRWATPARSGSASPRTRRARPSSRSPQSRGVPAGPLGGHRVRRPRARAASPTRSPGDRSRWPARSPWACAAVVHPKLVRGFDATLVVVPGARPRVRRGRLGPGAAGSGARRGPAARPGRDHPRRRAASTRASPRAAPTARCPKFRPGGLMIVHAGGGAGMFSAVIGGWAGGPGGSAPVTREVDPWR